MDFRWAGGDAERARTYAVELVRLMPDVIIANSTLCLKAVRNEPARYQLYSCLPAIRRTGFVRIMRGSPMRCSTNRTGQCL